mgnify:FL=1
MIYQQSMFQKAVSNKVESISKDLENAKALAGQEPTWSIPDKITNRSEGTCGIGVYKIYHKDWIAEDVPLYIGQGNVSARKNRHASVFKNKGKILASGGDSHAAKKMYAYDTDINNWYFSFCIVGNKSVASEYEDLLIKSQEPEFNNPSMSGVN